MAGEGAKKRLETNQRRLSALRTAALLTTLLFAAVRLWARTASAGGWHVAGFVVTLLMHGFSYLAIAAAAQPTYASSGVLLDGGGDLDKGMASSYHDILYITCAVQVLAAFSDYGWWLYAVIPAYGSYKLWTGFIYPQFKAATRDDGPAEVDERTRARMERTDKRAERRRVKRF